MEGGRLVSLMVGGAERIVPKESALAISPPIYWGCFPMVPWAGRLANGLGPTGDVRRVTADEDLRSGPALGRRRLDHVYVRAAGPALVRWPDLDLVIEYDATLNTVVVHTPREGICVEPQTMWPNAPLLAARAVPDTGLRILAPGERLRVATRWTWRRR